MGRGPCFSLLASRLSIQLHPHQYRPGRGWRKVVPQQPVASRPLRPNPRIERASNRRPHAHERPHHAPVKNDPRPIFAEFAVAFTPLLRSAPTTCMIPMAGFPKEVA